MQKFGLLLVVYFLATQHNTNTLKHVSRKGINGGRVGGSKVSKAKQMLIAFMLGGGISIGMCHWNRCTFSNMLHRFAF